jgi:hypothetical protein
MTVTKAAKVVPTPVIAQMHGSLLHLLTLRISWTVNQAFVLHPGGKFAFEERPKPTLQSDRDVIVRVIATGLCGSDVSEMASNFPISLFLHYSIFRDAIENNTSPYRSITGNTVG